MANPKPFVPVDHSNNLNRHLRVPVIYDEANEHRTLTKRLIIKMKKAMRLLGDTPQHLAIDGSQLLDLADPEDYSIDAIEEELELEVAIIERLLRYRGDICPDPGGRNRFCVMTGEAGKVVIGAYPATYDEQEGPDA